jgi:hypothetical protein
MISVQPINFSDVYIMVDQGAGDSWLLRVVQDFIQPGVSGSLMTFTLVVIFLMTCFFAIWPLFVDYSVHYVIMAVLSFCFLLSFIYFSHHLKKNPEFMRPERPKID